MTRDIVIRVDNDTRVKLGSGERASVSVEAGVHRVEAALGKETPCVIDVRVGDHDEVNFACRIDNFFHPTLMLEQIGHATIRQRFKIDREEAQERADDPRSVQTWTQILGVRPDATGMEIRRAYLQQMRLYHPDRNANLSDAMREVAEWKAREINIAYAAARRYLKAG